MLTKNHWIAYGLFLLLTSCHPDMLADEINTSKLQQDYRPQIHFSPANNWMEAPIKSIFFDDEYHVFYQCTENKKAGTKMHWGHAVSTDLLHWQRLDPVFSQTDSLEALYGSIVIDWDNTTNFSTDGEPPFVAIFSSKNNKGQIQQSLAYSTDKGRQWTLYTTNPVLTSEQTLYDPNVIWDSDAKHWLMTIASDHSLLFYNSPDLKEWQYMSSFKKPYDGSNTSWSKPNMFPLFVPETGDKRWVLLFGVEGGAPNGGSGTQYYVGEFYNKRFKLDQEFSPIFNKRNRYNKAVWLDYGCDYYAASGWQNIMQEQNQKRLIITAWMNNWQYATQLPTQEWQGALSFPRQISLHSTPLGPRIHQQFAHELNSLRKKKVPISLPSSFVGTHHLDCSPEQLELILEAAVAQDSASRIGFRLSNEQGDIYEIGYDAKGYNYFSDRTKAGDNSFSNTFASQIHLAPKQLEGSLIKLHLLLDRSSCEMIAEDGLSVISDRFFVKQAFNKIDFFAEGTNADIQHIEAYELKSIWD